MLSLKHFMQLLVIILLLSVCFLYLNVNNRTEVSKDSTNTRLVLPDGDRGDCVETEAGREKAVPSPAEYYVVYSGGDETEQKIYENVCRYLGHMKLSFETMGYVTKGELSRGITLIFCNTRANEGMDVEVLADFVKTGGKALFAAGIPEAYTDSFLSPLWGVVEKGTRLESTTWLIHSGFMPTDETTVKSPDFEASTRVKLDGSAQIYMEDEENNIPVVYGCAYGEGGSVMINSTLMQNRYSGGVFAAALGALGGKLMYPVIGTVSIFLDDFPFILAGYDRNCVNYYGRSMESFERDILWPVLLSWSSGYGIKYTMNLYEQQEDIDEDLLNERLLSYLARENMRYSGEIMISRYYDNGEKEELRDLFEKHFPNYEIQAFSGRFPEEEDKEPVQGEETQDLPPIERGSYAGDGKRQEAQDFNADGEKVDFPVMSSGFSMEDAAYRYLSGVGLYGVVSHSLPMTQMITASSVEESYEGVKKDMGRLLEELGSQTRWLDAATVTEAAGRVASWEQVRPKVTCTEDEIRVSCGNFTKGQKFLFRSAHEIKEITGGKAKRVNAAWYCLEAEEAEMTVSVKEQKGS